jgi:hypothetical protein
MNDPLEERSLPIDDNAMAYIGARSILLRIWNGPITVNERSLPIVEAGARGLMPSSTGELGLSVRERRKEPAYRRMHVSEDESGLDRRARTVPLSSTEGLSRWPTPRSIY